MQCEYGDGLLASCDQEAIGELEITLEGGQVITRQLCAGCYQDVKASLLSDIAILGEPVYVGREHEAPLDAITDMANLYRMCCTCNGPQPEGAASIHDDHHLLHSETCMYRKHFERAVEMAHTRMKELMTTANLRLEE